MNLLFDQNISYRIIKKLSTQFSNSKHVSDLGLSNANDSSIWEFAKKNDLTIVTFDSDFYDMSLMYGCPPKIIWIRTGNILTNEMISLFEKHKELLLNFISKDEYADISCLEIY